MAAETVKDVLNRGALTNLQNALELINLGTLLTSMATPYAETVDTSSGDTATLTYKPVPTSLQVQLNTAPLARRINGTQGAGQFKLVAPKTLNVASGAGHASTYVEYITYDQTARNGTVVNIVDILGHTWAQTTYLT